MSGSCGCEYWNCSHFDYMNSQNMIPIFTLWKIKLALFHYKAQQLPHRQSQSFLAHIPSESVIHDCEPWIMVINISSQEKGQWQHLWKVNNLCDIHLTLKIVLYSASIFWAACMGFVLSTHSHVLMVGSQNFLHWSKWGSRYLRKVNCRKRSGSREKEGE